MPRTLTSAILDAYAVTTADVDGDGDMDPVSAGWSSGRFYRHQNLTIHRSALFGGAATVSSGTDTPRVLAGDFNRDGDIDLLSIFDLGLQMAWHDNTNRDGSAWTQRPIHLSQNLVRYQAIAAAGARVEPSGGACRFDPPIRIVRHSGVAAPNSDAHRPRLI